MEIWHRSQDFVVREIIDQKTGQIIERRTPDVVVRKSQPSGSAVAGQWSKARNRFNTLIREINEAPKRLEDLRATCRRLPAERKKLAGLQEQHANLDEQAATAERLLDERTLARDEPAAETRRASADVARNGVLRPGFFARPFGTSRWR